VAVAGPVGVLLFDAGTEDVLGQLDKAVACGGDVGCPTAGLHFEAEVRGTYLLDVFSTGSTGDYRLTWTVRNAAGLPIEVAVPACSPNGDGVQDGDRDTTTFAMTSSERGRLRVVIYRYASTTVVRVLVSGTQAAGRQRLSWTGKTSSGAFLRGTFSHVIEATDAAGNTSRSGRHRIRVL
jgi:hypothetical protein